MENDIIYKQWIRYIKEKKLYGRYIFEIGNYIRAVEKKEEVRTAHTFKPIDFYFMYPTSLNKMELESCFIRRNVKHTKKRDLEVLFISVSYDSNLHRLNAYDWYSVFRKFIDLNKTNPIGTRLSRKFTRANNKVTSYRSKQENETKWYDKFYDKQPINNWRKCRI